MAQAAAPTPAAIASAVALEGFCCIPGLLTPAEVAGIRSMAEDEDGPRKYAYRGTTKMASFPKPGDDVLGRLARSRRLHAVAEAAVGIGPVPGQGPLDHEEGEGGQGDEVGVQLHHVQVTLKEARSEYAFAWHQGNEWGAGLGVGGRLVLRIDHRHATRHDEEPSTNHSPSRRGRLWVPLPWACASTADVHTGNRDRPMPPRKRRAGDPGALPRLRTVRGRRQTASMHGGHFVWTDLRTTCT